MEKHILAELANAAANGNVLKLDDTFNLISDAPDHDWDMPSFDFGYSLDRGGSRCISEEDWKVVDSKAEELIGARLRLPYPKCAFVLMAENRAAVGKVHMTIYRASEQESGLEVDIFEKETGGFWLRHFRRISFNNDTRDIRDIPGYDLDNIDCDMVKQQVSLHVNFIFQALAVLWHCPHGYDEVQKRSPLQFLLNKKRSKDGLRPVPDIVKLPIRWMLRERSEQAASLQTARAPHSRRAHYRRLRSGRVVAVKACAIHGGSRASHYEVR